jgi:hypothetical protein
MVAVIPSRRPGRARPQNGRNVAMVAFKLNGSSVRADAPDTAPLLYVLATISAWRASSMAAAARNAAPAR